MLLARTIGNVVATRKDARLEGLKLLIVEPLLPDLKSAGQPFVAVDSVQAGPGDNVLVVQGSSARLAKGLGEAPVDATIVGIIDHVDITR